MANHECPYKYPACIGSRECPYKYSGCDSSALKKIALGAQYVPQPAANIPHMVLMNRKGGGTLYLNLTCTRFSTAAKKDRIESAMRVLACGVLS